MRTDILQQAQAIRASMDAAALEPWQAGTSYAKGAAFVHNGAMYFARQGGSIRRASAAGQHGHGGHLRRSPHTGR